MPISSVSQSTVKGGHQMTLLEEAREWLEKMKEHTDCCGTPIVRRLVSHMERGITEAEMAAGDLHSAATCGLSTLNGLGVPEGGRIQFIKGVLAKHAKYGIKADLNQTPTV